MGTRSITVVYDNTGNPITTIFRQFDGYPGGHGIDLARFLQDRRVIDGIQPMDQASKISNGMECLTASLIGTLKTNVGNIYVYSPEQTDFIQDYEYHIYPSFVEVKNWDKQSIYKGDWNSMLEFCQDDE